MCADVRETTRNDPDCFGFVSGGMAAGSGAARSPGSLWRMRPSVWSRWRRWGKAGPVWVFRSSVAISVDIWLGGRMHPHASGRVIWRRRLGRVHLALYDLGGARQATIMAARHRAVASPS
jgi:hypothetical protein